MEKILTHTIIKNKRMREKKLLINLQIETLFQFIWKIKKRGLIHG